MVANSCVAVPNIHIIFTEQTKKTNSNELLWRKKEYYLSKGITS